MPRHIPRHTVCTLPSFHYTQSRSSNCCHSTVGVKKISDLQIAVRGRLRVRVLSSEHAHFENFRPPNLKRVRSTENSYSQSSSYCNLKVANVQPAMYFSEVIRANSSKISTALNKGTLGFVKAKCITKRRPLRYKIKQTKADV